MVQCVSIFLVNLKKKHPEHLCLTCKISMDMLKNKFHF